MRVNMPFFGVVMILYSALMFWAPAVIAAEAAAVERRPVVLMISVLDKIAITEEGRDVLAKVFAVNYPDHRVVRIEAVSGRMSGDVAEIRKTIIAGLKTELRPSDLITHLVISSHGQTTKNADGSDYSSLQYLGEFGPNGPDEKLREVLFLIKPNLADDVKVVLDSCSTFCGPEEKILRRAKAFMNFIGAPNGSIYGQINPMVDQINLVDGRISRPLYNWRTFRMISFLTFASIFNVNFFMTIFNGMSPDSSPLFQILAEPAIVSGSSVMALYSLGLFIFPKVFQMLGKMKIINQGKLISFEKGQLREAVDLERSLETLADVYGLKTSGCENALTK